MKRDGSERWRVLLAAMQPGVKDAVRIEAGAAADYYALAHLHYRPGSPAQIERVLRAVDVPTGMMVGVLVAGRGTLNAPWRRGAFGAEFDAGDKRRAARAANGALRVISRVIVDPRFRGLGIARRLVEAYLARPLTPCTEAVAAMGRVCPFFERAGMRRVSVRAARRDRELAAVLRGLGLRASWLLEPGAAARAMRAHPRLRRAVRRWANDSRSTRGGAPDLSAAAASIAARPVVYVFRAGRLSR
ncbi:MAG: GNAT family N-acetyltransferase [Planctomycetes bacterium]|nr:GNAT family N-acetyltransferase [Planctomycetota bacterium]